MTIQRVQRSETARICSFLARGACAVVAAGALVPGLAEAACPAPYYPGGQTVVSHAA